MGVISSVGKGVAAGPARTVEEDPIFIKVEIESQYPGGASAWSRFLQKNLLYPDRANEDNIQGTVLVQFIVDRDGTVSDVQVISDRWRLGEAAVRIIKKSGKWEPVVQNGNQVKSYKKQPITFRLASK